MSFHYFFITVLVHDVSSVKVSDCQHEYNSYCIISSNLFCDAIDISWLCNIFCCIHIFSLNRIPSGLVSEDKFYVGSVDSSPTSSVQNLERLFQGSSLTSTLQHNSASDLGSLGGRGMKKARENRSYLWGPTGEQEWSPDMTTGSHVFLRLLHCFLTV